MFLDECRPNWATIVEQPPNPGQHPTKRTHTQTNQRRAERARTRRIKQARTAARVLPGRAAGSVADDSDGDAQQEAHGGAGAPMGVFHGGASGAFALLLAASQCSHRVVPLCGLNLGFQRSVCFVSARDHLHGNIARSQDLFVEIGPTPPDARSLGRVRPDMFDLF